MLTTKEEPTWPINLEYPKGFESRRKGDRSPCLASVSEQPGFAGGRSGVYSSGGSGLVHENASFFNVSFAISIKSPKVPSNI